MSSDFSDSSPSPANTPTPEPNPTPTPITSTPCPASKPTQGKKPVSIVWQHFTKLEGGDPNNLQAKCNHCGKMYGCHYRKHGTSQLKVHLEEQCKKSPVLKSLVENGQSRLNFKMTDGSSGAMGPTLKGYTKYNPDECRRKLARMIVMDELLFQFVEGKGFQEFVQELEPRFVLPSRHIMANDIKKMYIRDKDVLNGQLAGLVVCLTTDTWISIQNMNYMSLTVHFVDIDWVLYKKIIKFCQITDHKGETIGKALEAAIKEWGLEKVLSVSVDNALKDVDDSVARVRMAMKWVRSSPSKLEKFKVAAKATGITSKKGLCTDVPTRWNSNFLMLEAAQEYKTAFQLLGDEDIQYVKYFDEHGGSRKPNDDDWMAVSTFVDFLGLFYDVTLNISSSLYPTSPWFCQQICRVKEELEDMRRGSNEKMRGMTVTMMLKYDKYWGDLTRMNIFLYVDVILDSRLKVLGLLYALELVHDQAQNGLEIFGPENATGPKVQKGGAGRLTDCPPTPISTCQPLHCGHGGLAHGIRGETTEGNGNNGELTMGE
ncbi:hypothetical protein I3760_13G112600 [Carya illinoinensis]|nr:hypothetical protein I3760_13G112600 [Carya illinoinensis]